MNSEVLKIQGKNQQWCTCKNTFKNYTDMYMQKLCKFCKPNAQDLMASSDRTSNEVEV